MKRTFLRILLACALPVGLMLAAGSVTSAEAYPGTIIMSKGYPTKAKCQQVARTYSTSFTRVVRQCGNTLGYGWTSRT